MKALFKVSVVIFSLALLFVQCEKEPEVNPNDPVNIPDTAFSSALIKQGIDINGDGEISFGEAESITKLDVSGYYAGRDRADIKSLKGIEAFVNLEVLQCGFGEVTDLPIANNNKLKKLTCWGNSLTSLDVSQNIALNILWCSENLLTSLDVSQNIALEVLGCGNNQLTTLDISNNTVLEDLWCGSNQLVSLDVTNNSSLYNLDLWDMPTLKEVCVWTMPFPPEGVYVNTLNSPNVYFTTECSE